MITRRRLIVAGAAAGGAVVAYQLYGDGAAPESEGALERASDRASEQGLEVEAQLSIDAGLGEPMNALLQSMDHADRLGHSWLSEQPTRPGLAQLAAELATRVDPRASDLRRTVAERVRQDFAEGDVCQVEGWTLSLTECQLAGLRVLAVEADPANAAILEARRAAEQNESLRIGEIAPLKNWGPKKAIQGQSFNTQPDGHSGMWFQITGAPARARIMIDGNLARTTVRPDVVTSGLYGQVQQHILSTPGKYEIALVDPVQGIKQPIGELVVEADPSLKVDKADAPPEGFCPPTRWGPRKTRVGVPRNEQPDGSMGVWVHMDCLPRGVTLKFGDDPLPLTRSDFGFTSSIPLPLIESPGRKPLTLVNPASGVEFTVGHIEIVE